jgi:BirA family biotin operon repressor/biotin-[acetyl-CoA-carboxylase] ligase
MFDVARFQRRRKGRFGRDLYYFEEQESTNLTAQELARDGAAEGTLVLADRQTGGKGRKGNAWFSPAEVNLYFSLILRPDISRVHHLPFLAALSVAAALQLLGLEVDLKWPNDVLLGERKVGGILIDTSTEQGKLIFAVLGCGINANTVVFPSELERSATSVLLARGEEVSREGLLASFLLEFERVYEKIDETSWASVCAELEKHSSYLRGCSVEVRQEGRVIEGTTCGLDNYGGLIIQTAGGRETVYAGEVQTCRRKQQATS